MNSSAVLVEWPIVQTRLVGIDQFAFNRLTGKERTRRREIRLELLLVLWDWFSRFELDHGDTAVRPMNEAIEGSSQNLLRPGNADRKRHFEGRLT